MNAQMLLAHYGSPAYVYDLAQVRAAHTALREALAQPSELFYSLKANPHPALVATLRSLGCQAEVSSAGELSTALGCGFAPAACLYTGPGKTRDEISSAIRQGVTLFSVDSPHDLGKVATAAAAAHTPVRVILRVNPEDATAGLGLAMTGAASQFGADARWICQEPGLFAGAAWAEVIGFHCYTGTNITTTEALLQTFTIAVNLIAELSAALDIRPQLVDLGGGFGHPFATGGARIDFSSLRGPLEALLDERLKGWRAGQPRIAFESGRYLVAGAGMLLCTVQDVKSSKGRRFIVLDTGIHHLGGMAGLRRVPNIGAELVGPEAPGALDALRRVDVVGPLCTPLDYLARGIDLPDLDPDQVVAIPNVGAYGLTASLLAFLSHQTPVEIVLDGGNVYDVSRLILTRRSEPEEKNRGGAYA